MAQCSKCGTKVGCGCQLKNGMCSACNSVKSGTQNVTQQTSTQNATTQAIKLS